MKMGAVVFAVLVVSTAIWWQVTHPSGTWRYKLTVTVETPEGIKYYRSLKAPPVVLEPDLYPQFVHFKDIDNPKTVELVMEMKSCGNPQSGIPRGTVCIEKDRFEEIFGEGVRLKSVTAEMTDEPADLGRVNKYLAWLPTLKGSYLHGGRTSREAPLGLHSGHFQIGKKQ